MVNAAAPQERLRANVWMATRVLIVRRILTNVLIIRARTVEPVSTGSTNTRANVRQATRERIVELISASRTLVKIMGSVGGGAMVKIRRERVIVQVQDSRARIVRQTCVMVLHVVDMAPVVEGRALVRQATRGRAVMFSIRAL